MCVSQSRIKIVKIWKITENILSSQLKFFFYKFQPLYSLVLYTNLQSYISAYFLNDKILVNEKDILSDNVVVKISDYAMLQSNKRSTDLRNISWRLRKKLPILQLRKFP